MWIIARARFGDHLEYLKTGWEPFAVVEETSTSNMTGHVVKTIFIYLRKGEDSWKLILPEGE